MAGSSPGRSTPPSDSESARRQHDALRQALHDLPVPDGLEDRLLARLGVTATSVSQSRGPSAVAEQSRAASGRKRISRRTWIGASVAAASGGVLCGAGYWIQRPLTEQEVIQQATLWLTQRHDWTTGWKVGVPAQGLAAAPLPAALKSSARRWKQIRSEYGARIVVYDVSLPGAGALLFVNRPWRGLAQLSSVPPRVPVPRTRGWYLAPWQQSRRYLYVLALLGNQRMYPHIVDAAAHLA